ncbi:TPA: polysaccharide biosynthesis tyrosine autokinase [Serratia marcescens]
MSEKKHVTEPCDSGQINSNLHHLVGVLLEHHKFIIGLVFLFAGMSIGYTWLATPLYRADVLIQVEKNAADSLVSNVSEAFAQDQEVKDAAEMALLFSRRVIGEAVSTLKLDIDAKEKVVPVIGTLISKVTGDKKYIIVDVLDVPENLQDKTLRLDVISQKKYKIMTEQGDVITGEFNNPILEGGVSVLINKGNSTVGDTFELVKKSKITAINSVIANLSFVSNDRDSGIFRVFYQGTDPEKVVSALNEIAKNYLNQNIKDKSAQAEKGLDFLSVQLPIKKNDLVLAEDALNKHRRNSNSLDMTLEAQQLLKRGVALDTQLNALTIQEVDVSQAYTKEYPSYKALLDKKKAIEEERSKINYSIANLPENQQQLIRLSRDVLVGQAVYVLLLQKEQELRVTKASIIGDVRIVDYAELRNGVASLNSKVIIFVSIYLGFIFAFILVLLKTILYKRVEKIEELGQLGVSVLATIPFSSIQGEIIKKERKGENKKFLQHTILADFDPSDLAIEALRGLRTSLHFTMIESNNNVLMISGVSPGCGKTFISANLSSLITKSGKRVLLLDADLRKGYVHELFSLKNELGLSSFLTSSEVDVSKYIQHDERTGLDIIPRGKIAPNPSELLMTARFEFLVSTLSNMYDFVIIDTPPIMAVTDPSIIGRHAGTTMLVVGFAKNTVKEVEMSISRFEKSGVSISGLIVNGYVKKATESYSEGSYYNYGYKYR